MRQLKPLAPSVDSIDVSTEENRVKVAKMVLALFEHWQLNQADQLNLLNMSEESRGSLAKYRKGNVAFPKNRDLFDRIGYLFAIHKALRLLYPRNPNVRYSWIHLRNKAFDNHSPLEVMQEEGIIGLARVARYLDFVRGH